MSGMRFANVGVARSGRIVSANLKIRSLSEEFRGQIYGVIHAEAVDDAVDFSARYIADANKTSSGVNWGHKFAWEKHTWQISPDIANNVQEIVNRPGWNSGNSLVVFYSTRADSRKSRMFGSFEADAGAILEITYEVYTISGYVTASDGNGLASVAISAGEDVEGTATDSSGYYQLKVPPGWSGTVTPGKAGWRLSPSDRAYSNVLSDQLNQDFVAFQPTISGYVTDSEGHGVEGVLFSADNGGTWDITDLSGYYQITVAYGWSGTVTPTKTDWGIIPASRTYDNVLGDQTNHDYTAVAPPVIAGVVRDVNGLGTAGVLVAVDPCGSDTTDSNGYYELTVPYGWSGTVTPSASGVDFYPEQRTYENLVQNQSDQDYTSFTTKYAGGSGTADDPYLIYTSGQLNTIGADANDWDKHFRLMADIDVAGYSGTSFNIIGDDTLAFTGVFNGNGHGIYNFTYESPKGDYVGLFGYVDGPNAEIRGVTIVEPNLQAGNGDYVGALVGYLGTGKITACSVVGGTIAGDVSIGGLVGSNSNGNVDYCYVYTDVKTDGYAVGGLIGSNSGQVTDCFASGTIEKLYSSLGWMMGGLVGFNNGRISGSHSIAAVSGSERIGGLVGHNWSGTVAGCHAGGMVSATTTDVGGLIGQNEMGTVSHCHASATVTGDWHSIGGLIGDQCRGGTVSDSSATGDVIGGDSVGGLIGYNTGRITNCFASGTVSGGYGVAGLVGGNTGILANCYAMGQASGDDNHVGGLVASNGSHGLVHGCYARGRTSGIQYVGGLVGANKDSAQVDKCYATGEVTGNINLGGLVGRCDDPDYVQDCFWDTQTTGRSTSAAGIGKTTAQMRDPSTFLAAGWDFVGEQENGPSDFWAMPSGGGYPILWSQLPEPPNVPAFSGGSGTSVDPYLLSTSTQLNSVGCNPRLIKSHFKLTGDIDLSGTEVWMIGSRAHVFAGGFDGAGHAISGIALDKPDANYVGLFGMVDYGASIRNVRLLDVHVSGDDYVGGLAGHNYSDNIMACSSSGGVHGHSYVGGLFGGNWGDLKRLSSTAVVTGEFLYAGGLVGWNNGGTINECFAKAVVSGYWGMGGLVGRNDDALILNSFSISSVSGESSVGGMTGFQTDTSVVRSYAAGPVTGTGSDIGGLIGHAHSGGAPPSFWDVNTTGQASSDGGGTGLTTHQMQTGSTFIDAGWDFVGEMVNGTEDIWRMCVDGVSYPLLSWQFGSDFLCPDGVDFVDYCYLADRWGDNNCETANDCNRTDIDLSGEVDWGDLKMLCEGWLEGI